MEDKYMDAWRKWNASKTPGNLQELLDIFDKDIMSKKSLFMKADVPQFSVEAAAKKAIVDAANTFDPDKGVNFRTHALNYMMKVNRTVYNYQNVGKIPEERILNIARYRTADQKLTDALGRKPSSLELAEELVWDVKEVIRMKSELRRGLSGEDAGVAMSEYDFATEGAIDYIYYSLPSELKNFFEYTVGYKGHPKLSAAEIKKELRMSDIDYRNARDKLHRFLKQSNVAELL